MKIIGKKENNPGYVFVPYIMGQQCATVSGSFTPISRRRRIRKIISKIDEISNL